MGYYMLDNQNPYGEHFYRSRRSPLLAIVVHCTAGLEDTDLIGVDQSAENTARYAATTDRSVSWHSGSDSDTWLNLLPYDYTGWQCVNYNSTTAGHEISKRDMSWSDEPAEWVTRTLTIAARGLRTKAFRHGIPLRRATKAELDRAIATGGPPVGFIGHRELDPTRRTDPGTDFPWDRFFALMTPPPATPVEEEDDGMKPYANEVRPGVWYYILPSGLIVKNLSNDAGGVGAFRAVYETRSGNALQYDIVASKVNNL